MTDKDRRSDKDRRRAQRTRAELVVELYEPEGRLVLGIGRVLDLSLVGFYLEGSVQLHPGQVLRARIRWQKGSNLEVPIKVAWARRKGTRNAYGMEFVGITKSDLARLQEAMPAK
jgi:hypothetical protein